MQKLWTVFKLTYAFQPILKIDFTYISLIFILRDIVSYILVMSMTSMVKKASRFFCRPLYIIYLYSEAILNANSALSIHCCSPCWCGVVLHFSMSSQVGLGCVPILHLSLSPLLFGLQTESAPTRESASINHILLACLGLQSKGYKEVCVVKWDVALVSYRSLWSSDQYGCTVS